jgi:hypothetical protein
MVVKINPCILLPNSRKKGELAVKKINYDIDAEDILIIAHHHQLISAPMGLGRVP